MKKILSISICMLAFVCLAMPQTNQEKTKKDIEFAQEAAEGSLMEVRLGQLAQTNAATPEVKRSGQQMVEDHGKANEELKSIADKKNITLPTSINEKMQKKYNSLTGLSGKEFDKKYARCMVKDHKKDICLFKKEAKKGNDPELKAWASGKIPTLESHLTMWKEACKAARK